MVDPNAINTRRELAAAIAEVLQHDTRSYQAIAADAQLGVATVYDMANGKTLPRWRSLEDLLVACETTAPALDAWRDAHRRAQAATSDSGTLTDLNPTDATVPASGTAPGLEPSLPPKVPRRLRRVGLWAAGALALVVIVVVGSAVAMNLDDNAPAKPPFTAAVKSVFPDNCAELIVTQPADQLGTPPPYGGYSDWANTHEAAVVDQAMIQISLAGAKTKPVFITGLYAEVTDRSAGPLHGIRVNGQCGNPFKGNYAEIDLDTKPPKIVGSNADPTQYFEPNTFSTTPLVFPYRISDSESELLMIIATSPRKDTVSFRLHLDWTDGRTNGTLTLNDGNSFKVATAEPDAPLYVADRTTFKQLK